MRSTNVPVNISAAPSTTARTIQKTATIRSCHAKSNAAIPEILFRRRFGSDKVPPMPLNPSTSARIDEIVRRHQSGGRAPSVLAGVARDDVLLHNRAAGLPVDVPAEVQSRVGSISKTFTAALVLALRDEGALDLD